MKSDDVAIIERALNRHNNRRWLVWDGSPSESLPDIPLDEETEEVRQLLQKIEHSDNNDVLLEALYRLGEVFYNSRHYNRSRYCYQQSFAFVPQDAEYQAFLASCIGRTYFAQADYLTARKYYSESLAKAQENGIIPGVSQNLLRLGNVALSLGEYNEAETLTLASLDLQLQEHHAKGIMNSTRLVCEIALHTKETKALAICLEKLNGHAEAVELVKSTLSTLRMEGETSNEPS